MTERPTVLVPIRVLEGESVPEGVPELLANAHVVLLGYHVVPDQTAPDQARLQFEDKATDRLSALAEMFADAGATVDTQLVFTHEGQKTLDRMIVEHDCLAVLVPNAVGELEELLVAIRGTVGLDRLVRLVTGLFGTTAVQVTLYHVAAEDETDQDVETLLSGVANRLTEEAFDEDAVSTRVARETKPLRAVTEVADEFDAVVMGESDPSLATFVFGMPAETVADRFLGPVLVVQREKPPEDDEPDAE